MTGVAEQTTRTDLLFKALASGVRREIVRTLAASACAGTDRCCADEVCACTFAEQLGLGAPTVSHHMRILQDAGHCRRREAWAVGLLPAGSERARRHGRRRCGSGPETRLAGRVQVGDDAVTDAGCQLVLIRRA